MSYGTPLPKEQTYKKQYLDEVLGRSRDTARMQERARKTVVEKFDLRRVCLPRHLKLLGMDSKKNK